MIRARRATLISKGVSVSTAAKAYRFLRAVLMTAVGEDRQRARAALIYQHEARGADKRITDAIVSHVQAERDGQGDEDDGPAGALVPAG